MDEEAKIEAAAKALILALLTGAGALEVEDPDGKVWKIRLTRPAD